MEILFDYELDSVEWESFNSLERFDVILVLFWEWIFFLFLDCVFLDEVIIVLYFNIWGNGLIWFNILFWIIFLVNLWLVDFLFVDFWVVCFLESLFLWDELLEFILGWVVFDEGLLMLWYFDDMFLLFWGLLFFLLLDGVWMKVKIWCLCILNYLEDC